jgi:hypothetical protein
MTLAGQCGEMGDGRRKKGEAKKIPTPGCPAISSHLKAAKSMVR